MKWKDRLLSSSVPLEYETGKLLVEKGFFVDFDYKYQRLDNQLEKEFSIDLKAGGFYPFLKDSEIEAKIDILIECKYRNPDVTWLFVPDINEDEYSLFTSKGAIKLIDEFTEFHYKGILFDSMNGFGLRVVKGIEINNRTNEVHDTGIHHGINQLSYVLPSLIEDHIFENLSSDLGECHPYFLIPILVTSADLRILSDDFSTEKIKESNNFEDFSESVPYLFFHTDVYPSFKLHCRNTFATIPFSANQQERLKYFKELRTIEKIDLKNRNFDDFYSNPSILLDGLKNGIENDLFRELIICNINNLEELLDTIKENIQLKIKNTTKIKK